MARPKNTEEYSRIKKTAFSLFIENGYINTKYVDIAHAAGCQKSKVQHYFSKKDILIKALLSEILTLSIEHLDRTHIRTNDPIVDNYLVGQVYYSCLLREENMRRLTIDVLSSRVLSDEIMHIDREWSFALLGVDDDRNEFLQEMQIIASGGVYDYIYWSLKNNKIPDATHLAFQAVSVYLFLGYEMPAEECRTLLKPHTLSVDTLDTATESVLTALRELTLPT